MYVFLCSTNRWSEKREKWQEYFNTAFLIWVLLVCRTCWASLTDSFYAVPAANWATLEHLTQIHTQNEQNGFTQPVGMRLSQCSECLFDFYYRSFRSFAITLMELTTFQFTIYYMHVRARVRVCCLLCMLPDYAQKGKLDNQCQVKRNCAMIK